MKDTVLIVEDEPDILDLVSYNLRQAGFAVLEAEDGEKALVTIEEEVVNLVVLDLMLPGIDGLEVCRLLKQGACNRELPILMLTARTEEVDRIVGLELGADDYLVKPFSPRELVLRIRAILRRAQGSEEAESERLLPPPTRSCERSRAVTADRSLSRSNSRSAQCATVPARGPATR